MRPARHGGRWPLRRLALVSTTCPALAIAAIAVMHALRDDLDPARHPVSEYAIGDFGALQTLAFLLMAAGAFALAAGLRRTVASRAAPPLITVFGAGMLTVAAFPTDPLDNGDTTFTGTVHVIAAFVGFGALIVAMALLVRARAFGRFHRTTAALAVAAGLLYVALLSVPEDVHGIYQRVFLGIVLGWLILAGLRLRRAARDPGPRPPSGPLPLRERQHAAAGR